VRLPEPPLLVITDRRQAALPLVDVVAAALAGGCRWISLREKDLPEGEQVAWAEKLLPLAHRFGARFTIHGDIAAATILDGVHLPEGGDARAARRRLGVKKLIGLSVHTPRQAADADTTLLDYLVAGPVYESASKPGYGPALSSKGLAEFVRATTLPVIAIGGIDATNIAEVMQAGAAGVAVMGGVMRASDPARTARELLATLKDAKSFTGA
jgi:thiamine-phosphate pyrophosphorylase